MIIASIIGVVIVALGAMTTQIYMYNEYRKDLKVMAEKLSAKTWQDSINLDYKDHIAEVMHLTDEEEAEIEAKKRG